MNWKNLSYKKKNRLLLIAMGLLILLSWNFAFRKTVDSISLHSKLLKQTDSPQTFAYNADYAKEKAWLLDSIVNRYTADSALWKNNFWMNVSRTVQSQNIRVVFQPNEKYKDSKAASPVARQEISFEADYKKLVVLLDSLKTIKDAGYINSITFAKDKRKRNNNFNKLRLNVIFTIITK